MRLAEGAKAPTFDATDWQGKPVKLADYAGKKTWLAFFRYAGCPLCNLRVHHLIERHAALREAGLEVVGVFQSSPEGMAKYVGKQNPPFPLISDPEEKLYALYGLESGLGAYLSPSNFGRLGQAIAKGFAPGSPEGTKTRIPADFLLDGDQTIRRAFYGKVIADHLPFEEVDRFLTSSRP
jgi:peroxiredoxin